MIDSFSRVKLQQKRSKNAPNHRNRLRSLIFNLLAILDPDSDPVKSGIVTALLSTQLICLFVIAEPGRGAAEGEEPRGHLHPRPGALWPRPLWGGRTEGEPRGRARIPHGRGGRRVKEDNDCEL